VDELVHEIHSSEIRGLDECPQEWAWEYRDGWEPIRTPKPLEFGRAWHLALKEVYDPHVWRQRTKQQLLDDAWEVFQQECNVQIDEYLGRLGKIVLDAQDAEDYAERRRLGRNMLVNVVRSLDFELFTPIVVEQEYQVELNLRCRCMRCWQKYMDRYEPLLEKIVASKAVQSGRVSVAPPHEWRGLPVVFGCRIDAIFEDPVGSLWLVDHKSAAQLLSYEDIDYLQQDTQLGMYLWAAWQLDIQVCGAIYNQFRKTYPKPPKLLQGGGYSVNKLQLTDYYTALRTFKKDKVGFRQGRYDAYLYWLQQEGKEYFRQFKIFKTPAQIDVIGRELMQATHEILYMDPDNVRPHPNLMRCGRCAFLSPCLAKRAGHDFQGELGAGFVQTPPWYEVERKRQRQ
jgi:hypothetical protein